MGDDRRVLIPGPQLPHIVINCAVRGIVGYLIPRACELVELGIVRYDLTWSSFHGPNRPVPPRSRLLDPATHTHPPIKSFPVLPFPPPLLLTIIWRRLENPFSFSRVLSSVQGPVPFFHAPFLSLAGKRESGGFSSPQLFLRGGSGGCLILSSTPPPHTAPRRSSPRPGSTSAGAYDAAPPPSRSSPGLRAPPAHPPGPCREERPGLQPQGARVLRLGRLVSPPPRPRRPHSRGHRGIPRALLLRGQQLTTPATPSSSRSAVSSVTSSMSARSSRTSAPRFLPPRSERPSSRASRKTKSSASSPRSPSTPRRASATPSSSSSPPSRASG